MTNKFQIPQEVLDRVGEPDNRCVYCIQPLEEYKHHAGSKNRMATIEHLREEGPFYWRDVVVDGVLKQGGVKEEDLAICCVSCNSSRGAKPLIDWFAGEYCRERNIDRATVRGRVREYLRRIAV